MVLVDEATPVSSLIGAAVTALPFAVLHLINPRWVGFGDVKLLAVLGGTLGLLSAGLGLAALWLAGVAVMVTRPWVPDLVATVDSVRVLVVGVLGAGCCGSGGGRVMSGVVVVRAE